MTTLHKCLMLVSFAAPSLFWGALGCGLSSQDESSQPRLRAEPFAPDRTGVERTASDRTAPGAQTSGPRRTLTNNVRAAKVPPKQGTPEYKKKLDELTDIRLGSVDARIRCRSPKGSKACRGCAEAIRRLGTKAPPARPMRPVIAR